MGEGVWNPKFCVPKLAQINISFCKFHSFSRYERWVQGGKGSKGGTPPHLLLWLSAVPIHPSFRGPRVCVSKT